LGKAYTYLSSMSSWKTVSAQGGAAGLWVIADEKGEEKASGSGLGQLVSFLDQAETQVLFVAFRVAGVDAQENVTSTRPKIVRINWVGAKVPAMKKMGALAGKSTISGMWNGIAVEVEANKPSELSMNTIAVELLRSGGAHKPTKYDFGDGEIALSDVGNKA